MFDNLVLDAVEDLEAHWGPDMAEIEFAVEDVPMLSAAETAEFDPDVVADRGVPLGRLYRDGLAPISQPLIVVYRRPLEARATEREDRGDLIFAVISELVAELLGKDVEDL